MYITLADVSADDEDDTMLLKMTKIGTIKPSVWTITQINIAFIRTISQVIFY